MSTLREREQNLFNATETMAQFYDEIESFLTILYGNMERGGFAVKTERLRSGTFTIKNLTRRLLASVSIMYIRDAGKAVDIEDEEDDEGIDLEKAAKDTNTIITAETRIPLLTVHLFSPRTIPTSHTLISPLLLMGAIGNFEFLDRKTEAVSKATSHTIALSNLGQIHLNPNNQVGSVLGIRCWKPKDMKKYKLRGKLIAFEPLKLLEIDSQEKIKSITDKLMSYCAT